MNIITLFWNYRRKGLNDWFMQRFTVIFPLLYFIIIMGYVFTGPSLSDWRSLLFNEFMKVLGSLAALSVLWHTKLGLWVVASDYVPKGVLRNLATLAIYAYVWLMIGLFIYVYWS